MGAQRMFPPRARPGEPPSRKDLAVSSEPTADAPSLGQRIENGFEAWGYLICRYRTLGILVPLLVTVLLVSWLPEMQIDNSAESFLNKSDPAAIRFDEFRENFGRDDPILIAVRAPEIFDLTFLEKLRRFHEALESELPYVEEVTSLVNARDTRGDDDSLIVEDLMESWPESPADLAALRERVLSNPLYENTLISSDGGMTTITVEPFTYSTLTRDDSEDATSGFGDEEDESADVSPPYLSSVESSEIGFAVDALVERFAANDFEIFVAGAATLTNRINDYMIRDLTVYMSLAFAMIGVLLYVLFRRLAGVLIPLLVVFLALGTTHGVMVLLGLPASAAAQILPIFLLAVGICDAVHVLVIVYQRLSVGDEREAAIAYALGHSGLAIVMTSATTAAGMLSFAGAGLAPIAVLGMITPIGIGMALAYSLVLLPALLASVPLVSRSRSAGRRTAETLGHVLARIGEAAARHPGPVLAATAAIAAVALVGATQVKFSHNGMKWFPEEEPLPAAVELIDRELRGSITLEAIVDTGSAGGLHDPDVMGRIEAAPRPPPPIEQGPIFVGKATSIVDVVKETHQALNENRAAYYRLPEERQLIAQELLLFEQSGSDDLESITDTTYQKARVSFRIPWADALLYSALIDEIESVLGTSLGAEIDFEMTGLLVVLANVFEELLTSMTRSYVIALLLITPMMMMLLGSVSRGLLSMIPNVLPVLLTLGLMGWMGVALDISTIMIGAVVMGVAVDDTIHFMHKFQRYYETTGDTYLAIRATLETTGAALLFTTLVLTGGFSILALGTLVNIQNFGIMISFATAAAFLADLLVSPALMALATRARPVSAPRPAEAALTDR
jgi:predicted RND superfamily exporter protein